jgi:hypothetical protein
LPEIKAVWFGNISPISFSNHMSEINNKVREMLVCVNFQINSIHLHWSQLRWKNGIQHKSAGNLEISVGFYMARK